LAGWDVYIEFRDAAHKLVLYSTLALQIPSIVIADNVTCNDL